MNRIEEKSIYMDVQHALLVMLLLITIKVSGQQVSLAIQTGHSVSVNRIRFSDDGKLLASAGADGRIVVWDIAAGRQLMILTGHRGSVNDITFGPKSTLASASDDGRVIVWSIADGTRIKEFSWDGQMKSVVFTNDGTRLLVSGKKISIIEISTWKINDTPFTAKNYFSSICVSKDGKLAAFTGEREKYVTVIEIDNPTASRKYRANGNEVAFSADGTYLVSADNNGSLKKFTLQHSTQGKRISTTERIWHSYLSTAISDRYYAAGAKNNLIVVHDLASSRKLKVLNGHSDDVMALAFSPDNTILASSGVDKEIILWNTSDWGIDKVLKGTVERVNAIQFAGSGEALIIGYGDGSFRYWTTEPGGDIISNGLKVKPSEKRKNKGYTISDITDFEKGIVTMDAYKVTRYKRKDGFKKVKAYAVKWSIEQNRVRLKGGRQQKRVDAKDIFVKSNLYDTLDDVHILARNTSETAHEVQIVNGNSRLAVNTNHSDEINSIAINPRKDIIATASSDGLIKFWDSKTGEPLVSLIASGANDGLFITPENYYFSTKGALEHIGFKIGTQIFSFEQFDVKFNRPDFVLEKLNHPDTVMRSAYRLAQAKRAQKSGAAIDDQSIHEMPQVILSSPVPGLSTRERNYPVFIDSKAIGSPITKVFLTVNGVPLYKDGLAVGMQVDHKEVIIELNSGLNKIQCYAVNEKNMSSLEQSLQITMKGNDDKPDLYLVTIGAAQYKDATYDLKYASKDAQDIDKLFGSKNQFGEVRKMSLINEMVTSENIHNLSDFLKPARVDDLVLISYSGHGLLDRNLDYFLSMYTTDFNDVQNGSLPYATLEAILENTKSRHKVLILDACHAGEIDKEEMVASVSAETSDGTINFRNVGVGAKRKDGANYKTSLEMSKVLFADTKTTHGAVIISSAAGGEYAIEGKSWNNGIFTYCFINGLKEMKADLNKDGNVTITELQRFVNKEVPKMSGGRQTPTSRDENVSNDFIIWAK